MATKNPSDVASKWSRNLSASTEDIRKGVNNVRVAPGEQAASKQAKMRQNLLSAIDSGKWADNTRAVTLQQWQGAMINKGLNRISQGATAAEPKMLAFMQKLLPYQEQLSATVDAMPDLTLEDSIARMTAFIRGMSNFKP